MSETDKQKSNQMRRRSDQGTLESWKAIANYLKRSVRTVRRWEAEEDLPVHRHQHTRGSSVYAYRAELDAWRDRQIQPRRPARDAGQARRRKTPDITRYAAIAVIAAIVGGGLGKILIDSNTVLTTADETSDAWVLITDTAGEASNHDVDDNLKAALRRTISRTENRHNLPRQRILQALTLMRLQPPVTLSPSTAREVALRDGQVSALLTSHVEQLAGVYVLSVEIVDPNSGALIAFPSEKADDVGSIVPAIERLASSVATSLQDLPEVSEALRLPPVTTSSLHALQLYSHAESYLRNHQLTAAMELLHLAMVEDPGFASALTLQAWAMRHAGASPDAYRPVAQTAAEFDGPISLPERYFIEGTYNHFAGELNRASANYHALMELDPEHLFGVRAVLDLCQELPATGNCLSETVRLAELQPDDFESNLQAAWALAADRGNADRADHFIERALTIMQQSPGVFAPESEARALIFPVISAWTDGDVSQVLQRGQRLRELLPALAIETQDPLSRQLAAVYLSLGKIADTRDILNDLRDPAQRYELEAAVMFAAGDKGGLKQHLESGENYHQKFTALLLAMAGLPEKALALHDELLAQGTRESQGAVIRAMIAMGAGRGKAAKSELQAVVGELAAEDQAFYFVGPDMLAKILKAEGNLPGAVGMLETTSSRRYEAAYNKSGLFWMMCQRQLANLYREAGRELEAIRIEDDLRELLIHADETFPLAQSLKEA